MADPKDPLADFKKALGQHSRSKAISTWKTVPAADKQKLKAEPDTVVEMLKVMESEAFPAMKDIGVDFSTDKRFAPTALDGISGGEGSQFLKQLDAGGQWASFIAAEPSHGKLTDPQVKGLARVVAASSDVAHTKALFQKTYPALQDATYAAGYLKSTAWGNLEAKRMYKALSDWLPVNHVQTISGGFFLGTDENLDGKGWNPLNFAWYDAHRVVMNKSSASDKNRGGYNHDMSGGFASGEKAGGKKNPYLSHFTGSALHEVGHGVGDSSGGDAWALTFYDWKAGATADAWSKNLFDDKHAQDAVDKKKLKKTLPAADARLYMANTLANTAYAVAGWANPAEIEAFIHKHYSHEKLYHYWKAIRSGTPEYHANSHNVNAGRVYVWLTRMGNQYVSYKKEALDTKVSWYSISSEKEWFAEQYAHYYRTSKTGPGQDAAVKAKLAEIDKMQWDNAGGNLTAPPKKGAPSAGGGADANAGDTATVAADQQKGSSGGPVHVDRFELQGW